MAKLIGYCLNPNHSKGKNKTRVFQAVLGITAENADQLYALVQRAAIKGDVVQQSETPFGRQFKVDWLVPNTGAVQL